MLSEYLKIYENQSNNIEDWKSYSKSDLCYKYLDLVNIDKKLADNYLSAIIYKFLFRAMRFYSSQKILTEEECYDITINSILYVLDKKVWEREDSSLYKNKSAPEIAINMRMKTQFMNAQYSKFRQKRRAYTESISLDYLEDEFSDGYFSSCKEDNIEDNVVLKSIVRKFFYSHNYGQAFAIDNIMNGSSFTKTSAPRFCKYRLISILNSLDIIYCKTFSKEYDISLQDVQNSLKYIKGINFNTVVNNLLKELRSNIDFYLFLKKC